MKNINLKPEKIEQFCQQWQIKELALFGSVLREDFNPQSDIDVLVSFAEDAKITFFDLDTIEQQISKLFDRPVDVVTKRAIARACCVSDIGSRNSLSSISPGWVGLILGESFQ